MKKITNKPNKQENEEERQTSIEDNYLYTV